MAIQLPLLNLHSQSSTPGIKMRIPVLPLLLAFLCLVPCSWSHALQNTPIVVSAITPAPSGDAMLYYDPSTGELIITANGVAATAITAQSDSPFDLSTVDTTVGFDGGISFEVDSLGDDDVMLHSAETFVDNQLVVFGFPLPTGVHNLGAILTPGVLTPADFIATFGDIRLDRIVQGQPIIEPSGVVRILVPDPIEMSISQGEAQRSMLREMEVTLPGDVQIDANAFSIVNRDDNSISPDVSFTTELVNGSTVATLTFSGDDINNSGSLPDGNYELTIDGDLITNAQGNALDADEDGTPGGQLVLGDEADDDLYRFYGDVDGDRDVDVSDVGQFVATLFSTADSPNYNDTLDFEGDGDVDVCDVGPYVANLFEILLF